KPNDPRRGVDFRLAKSTAAGRKAIENQPGFVRLSPKAAKAATRRHLHGRPGDTPNSSHMLKSLNAFNLRPFSWRQPGQTLGVFRVQRDSCRAVVHEGNFAFCDRHGKGETNLSDQLASAS